MKNIKINNSVILSAIKALEKTASKTRKQLSDLVVSTQEEFELAGKLIKELKEKVKEAQKSEATILDPLKQAMEATKAHYKPFYNDVAELEADTKNKMRLFVEKQTKLIEKAKDDFEGGKIKKASTYMSKVENLSVQSAKGASVRKVKVLVINDASRIPREYLIPDAAKIKEALLQGKTIAGCEIKLENSIAI